MAKASACRSSKPRSTNCPSSRATFPCSGKWRACMCFISTAHKLTSLRAPSSTGRRCMPQINTPNRTPWHGCPGRKARHGCWRSSFLMKEGHHIDSAAVPPVQDFGVVWSNQSVSSFCPRKFKRMIVINKAGMKVLPESV